jgi:FXSXX-COOH protein
MGEGVSAAVVDSGLVDLSDLDLDEIKALVEQAGVDDRSVLGLSLQRIWQEAASAGDAAAGFNSSL